MTARDNYPKLARQSFKYVCYVDKWALTILNANVNTFVCYEGRLPCANKKKVNYF